MAKYYGVQRTEEYLAHYGVKGMRWGVRKAIKSGSDKKLWRQYSKAQKKLNKLSRKADVSVQRRKEIDYEGKAKNYRTIGRVGLGIASAGLGGNQLAQVLRNNIWKKYYSNREAVQNDYISRLDDMFKNSGNDYVDAKTGMPAWATPGAYADHIKSESKKIEDRLKTDMSLVEKERDKAFSRNKSAQNIGETLFYGGVGTALGGYGGYGINKLRARNARKRQTTAGHKAAVAKRDAWQKEMKSVFKGTKYAERFT